MGADCAHIAFASSFAGLSILSHDRCSRTMRIASPAVVCALNTQKSSTEGSANMNAEDMAWNTGKVRAPRKQNGGGRVQRGKIRVQGKYYRTPAPPPQAPGLRVTSGTARGRRLKSPNVYLRPMMSKVREALFSMLDMLEVIRSDGCTLDLFAGSGSVGIESLSRGMGKAVFVDSALECTDTITENLERCHLVENGVSVCARVENFLERGASYNNQRHYDLITLTPPYEEVDYAELMRSVARSDCVGEGTYVVVEYPVELKSLPPVIEHRLIGLRNRRYGRTVLALYVCQPAVDVEPKPEEFIDVTRK